MPYPIIMNGDHAQYEIDNANVPPEERSDWPLPSFNAVDWAKAFCKIANGFGYKDDKGEPIPEDWMVGWFANSLMRGFDERASRVDGAEVTGLEAHFLLLALDAYLGVDALGHIMSAKHGYSRPELQELRDKLFAGHEHPPEDLD